MSNEDAIKWLGNLKNDIGNPHYERLWPYAQALDEICALLEEQREQEERKYREDHPCEFCQEYSCDECGKAVKWE